MEVIKPNLQKAVDAVKDGKVLVCPTDTVYGLICDADNKKAVEKIYKIKNRPKNKFLPIFVRDIEMAKKLVEINSKQEEFLKKVWPGAVTVVIEKKRSALRIPNNKFLINLIKRVGPLAETSANISGEPSTAKIKEVLKYFNGRKYQPDLILDGGNLKSVKPSQVIDISGSCPVTLRR